MGIDWFPLWLSLRVAALSTLIAFLLGLWMAWLLARRDFKGRDIVDAAVTLPLVLPPTVLGYYLLVLLGSVVATGFIIAPVALHRTLFRQGEKEWLVHAANWCARLGLMTLALTIAGVVWLVFDVVVSREIAAIMGVATLVFLAALWAALPLVKRADD